MKKFLPLFYSLIIIIFFAILIVLAKFFGYGFTYQVTPSMPKGIYFTFPVKQINRNDIVLFYPPNDAKKIINAKHWAPMSGILIKHVIGVPNDFVCNKNHVITVNNKIFGKIYDYYLPGKKMPRVDFCAKLKDKQYLLLSTFINRSYDSRYFGPIDQSQIFAKAKIIIKL